MLPVTIFSDRIRQQILRKLTIKEYIHFLPCSRISVEISPRLPWRYEVSTYIMQIDKDGEVFIVHAESVYGLAPKFELVPDKVNIETLFGAPVSLRPSNLRIERSPNSTQQLSNAIKTMRFLNTRAEMVIVDLSDESPCDPAMLNEVLQEFNEDTLLHFENIETDTLYQYLHLPCLNNAWLTVACGVPYEYLTELKVFSLRMEQNALSAETLNLFLKNHTMKRFELEDWIQPEPFPLDQDPIVLKDLSYNKIWSTETHFASCFNDIAWNFADARAYLIEMENSFSLVYFDDTICYIERGNSREDVLENLRDLLSRLVYLRE